MKLAVPAGSQFSRWTVLREVEKSRCGRMFFCRCACGAERPVPMGALRNGASKSCGCIRKGNKQRCHVQPPRGLFREILEGILRRERIKHSHLARWIGLTPPQFNSLLLGKTHPLPERIDLIAHALAASERDTHRLHLAAARDRGYRI